MKSLFTLFFGLLALVSSAQASKSITATAGRVVAVSPLTIDASKAGEAQYYKMMYDQAKAEATAAHSDTLAAYAALQSGYNTAVGLLVGIVAIIAGIQALFNYRLNVQKIESFRGDMRAEAELFRNAIRAEMQESQRTVLEALSAGHTRNREALDSQIRAVEQRLQDTLIREVDIIRNQRNNEKINVRPAPSVEKEEEEITGFSIAVGVALEQVRIRVTQSEPIDLIVNQITSIINEYKADGGKDIMHPTYNDLVRVLLMPAAQALMTDSTKAEFTAAMTGLRRVRFFANPDNPSSTRKVDVDELASRLDRLSE